MANLQSIDEMDFMTTDNSVIDKERLKKRKVLSSFIRMFAFGVGIVLTAVIVAYTFNKAYPLPIICVRGCEYLGYVCWASTLGMRGWDIQTWIGTTAPERLNQSLAKILALVGIFAFVLSRELVPSI
jgi:hypothetical protein